MASSATIGVEKPTTRVDFTQSPFYVNTETRPWINDLGDHPHRAGVSAFGFGGTNFHVVLEEYTGTYYASTAVDLTPRKAELLVWQRGTRAEIVQELTQLETRLAAIATNDLAGLASAITSEENNRTGGNDAGAAGHRGLEHRRSAAKGQRRRHCWPIVIRSSIPAASTIPKPPRPSPARFASSTRAKVRSRSTCWAICCCRVPAAHEMFAQANRQLADFLPQPLSRYIYPAPVFDDVRQRNLKP